MAATKEICASTSAVTYIFSVVLFSNHIVYINIMLPDLTKRDLEPVKF